MKELWRQLAKIAGLATLLFWLSPAKADLNGYFLRGADFYQSQGEYFEGVLTSGLGGRLAGQSYSVNVTSTGFSIDWLEGKGPFQGANGFNGFVLTVLDGSPIASASILPTSTWSSFTDSHLTFDGSHVWADFGNLTSAPSLRLDVSVVTAVPENSPWMLMGSGLLLFGCIRAEKRRRATALGPRD